MASNSAFAGAFDEAAFRTNIRDTMRMGMPTDPAEQLTWRWKRVRTYNPQDRVAHPYDWTQTPTTDVPGNADEPDGELVVDYALEFSASIAAEGGTALGRFNTSRAVVTLIDADYELVKTADFATIAGAEYEIDFVSPPMGLFAVTVYQIHLRARDEQ